MLIHCDGKHFTLLRAYIAPHEENSPTHGAHVSRIPRLSAAVQLQKGVVQQHELTPRPGFSVSAVIEEPMNM